DTAMTWLVLLSFGTLVWLVYRLGETLFTRWAGVIGALVVVSRPAMERDVSLAYLDVPFATLVFGALLLEARRPRRGAAVLAVLAVAGLLRPEAWVLAGLYVLYLWPHATPRDRVRLVALAAIGPVVWLAGDAIVTGDPLHSLHGTAALADAADRHRTPGEVPYWTAQYFGFTLRVPVAAGILVGLLFAWRRGLRRWGLPVVVAAVFVAFFAIGPFFGLPLIGRYIRTPSALLAVFCGVAIAGWTLLPPSRARFRWGLLAVLVAVLNLVYVPRTIQLLSDVRHRRAQESRYYRGLRRISENRVVGAAFDRCPRLSTADHRPIPFVRWWLHGDPGSVGTIEQHAGAPAPLLLVPRPAPLNRRLYGPAFPHVAIPASYRLVHRNELWAVWAAPRCEARARG
ncbi:MAG: hypothetical protein QOD53_53, partial [Thermoleophilaceae bacterium]|nr:hypothetical protein [Thermoleophilaceae bacterium]